MKSFETNAYIHTTSQRLQNELSNKRAKTHHTRSTQDRKDIQAILWDLRNTRPRLTYASWRHDVANTSSLDSLPVHTTASPRLQPVGGDTIVSGWFFSSFVIKFNNKTWKNKNQEWSLKHYISFPLESTLWAFNTTPAPRLFFGARRPMPAEGQGH